jgi:hypothetical protein
VTKQCLTLVTQIHDTCQGVNSRVTGIAADLTQPTQRMPLLLVAQSCSSSPLPHPASLHYCSLLPLLLLLLLLCAHRTDCLRTNLSSCTPYSLIAALHILHPCLCHRLCCYPPYPSPPNTLCLQAVPIQFPRCYLPVPKTRMMMPYCSPASRLAFTLPGITLLLLPVRLHLPPSYPLLLAAVVTPHACCVLQTLLLC